MHTIYGISSVTFAILLWRSVTNRPVCHINAWAMLHFTLQTHSCGKRLSFQQYLDKIASKNSLLVDENLLSFNGKDDNRIEALSDAAISLAFNCAGVILLRRFFRRMS